MKSIAAISVFVAVLVGVNIQGGYGITKVTPFCADNPKTETSMLIVLIDQPDTTAFATCKGGNTYTLTPSNTVNFTVPVYGSGDPTTQCVFNEKQHSSTYYIKLSIDFGDVVSTQMTEVIMMCSYGRHQKNETDLKNVGFGDEAPIEIVRNMGDAAGSTFSMQVQSVIGRPLVGNIQLGRKIRLFAEASGTQWELGMKPLSCNAVGGTGVYYPFLRGGCGDGIIFPKTRGFTTSGLQVRSPFFRSFKLRGSTEIFFQCNFTVCYQNCNGDSCFTGIPGRRKKRDADLDGGILNTVLVHHKEQDDGTILTVKGEITYIKEKPRESEKKEVQPLELSPQQDAIDHKTNKEKEQASKEHALDSLNKTMTFVFLGLIGIAVLIGIAWVIVTFSKKKEETMFLIETDEIGSVKM